MVPKIFSKLTALGAYLAFRVAIPYAMEYAGCLLFTILLNITWFDRSLNAPVAALGVLGCLAFYRYIRVTSQPKQQSMPAYEIALPKSEADDIIQELQQRARNQSPSPYL